MREKGSARRRKRRDPGINTGKSGKTGTIDRNEGAKETRKNEEEENESGRR